MKESVVYYLRCNSLFKHLVKLFCLVVSFFIYYFFIFLDPLHPLLESNPPHYVLFYFEKIYTIINKNSLQIQNEL